MAKKCRFDEDCLAEPVAECSCINPTILLCEKHLQLHILTSLTQNHKIKALIAQISNDKKQIITTEILKTKINLSNFTQEYTKKVQELVENIYKKYSKCMGKIRKLDNNLTEMHDLVKNIKEVKIYEKSPGIVSVLLNEKENLIKKFKDLNLVNMEFVYKGQVVVAKLKENVVKNINVEPENLIQELCPKGHKLYLSIDSNDYYSFISGKASHALCDICDKQISSDDLHCRICSFDICDTCISKNNYIKYPKLTCSNHHELLWVSDLKIIVKESNVSCDLCGCRYSNSGWRCHLCDYDTCIKCGLSKGVLAPIAYPITCNKNHQLQCLNISNVVICSLCPATIDYPHWSCEECTYSLCRNCCKLRGYQFIYCQSGHQMFTYKKEKFTSESSFCKVCYKNCGDTGFTCNTCQNFLCSDCFVMCPQSFFRST